MPRLSHTEALLGPELFSKIRTMPVLVVGAGGIGCELLKNLALCGFGKIEIIDLDTIDLSNLNRQFLFRKPDISKPKALVAAATVRHFNPSSGVNVHARHGNVKDAENDLEWIKSFGLVMSALDNQDARRHLNRLCQAGNVPLIESGTAGYVGQVTPILHGKTECFDCLAKPAVKSFPVCTIRATPSEPIHCIVWGKSYLFGKLFGEDDEAVDEEELEKAKADGENADEIENLKKEAAAFREVRRMLGEEDGPQRVFKKVFNDDIHRLLSMEDMWKVAGRVKPVPLELEAIMDGTFIPPPTRSGTAAAGAPGAPGAAPKTPAPAPQANGTSGSAGLRDQRELSVKENLELFIDSCKRLSARSIAHPEIVLSFDKDDDDTLDFVLAVANLRATAYGIPTRTRFQVKEMAGNIIPAIATTNAMIAGLVVMRALAVLSTSASSSSTSSSTSTPASTSLRQAFIDPKRPECVGSAAVEGPNDTCAVCRDTYVPFKADVERVTLGEFVEDVAKGWLGAAQAGGDGDVEGEGEGEGQGQGEEIEWTVMEGSRVLSDPDFDDNHEKTLAELGVGQGKTITITDEEDKYRPIHFCLCAPEGNNEKPYVLPLSAPKLPLRPAKPQAMDEDEDEDEDEIVPLEGAQAVAAAAKVDAAAKAKIGVSVNGNEGVVADEEKKGTKRAADEVDGEGEGEKEKRRKVDDVIEIE